MQRTVGALYGGVQFVQSSWRQYVSLAFGMALEADLPEVLVRSVANPRSLLTLVLGSIYDKFALWT